MLCWFFLLHPAAYSYSFSSSSSSAASSAITTPSTHNRTSTSTHHQHHHNIINFAPPTQHHQHIIINTTSFTQHHQHTKEHHHQHIINTKTTPSTQHHQHISINTKSSTQHHPHTTEHQHQHIININTTPSTQHHQLWTTNTTQSTHHHHHHHHHHHDHHHHHHHYHHHRHHHQHNIIYTTLSTQHHLHYIISIGAPQSHFACHFSTRSISVSFCAAGAALGAPPERPRKPGDDWGLWTPAAFAWQMQLSEDLSLILRGRCSTRSGCREVRASPATIEYYGRRLLLRGTCSAWRPSVSFCVAGTRSTSREAAEVRRRLRTMDAGCFCVARAALGGPQCHFAWQALGAPPERPRKPGDDWGLWTPAAFAGQVQHSDLEHLSLILRGRPSAWSTWVSLCAAVAALEASQLRIAVAGQQNININTSSTPTRHHQHNTINFAPSTQHHQHIIIIIINTTSFTQHHQHIIINTKSSKQHHQHTKEHQHQRITNINTHHQHNTINTTEHQHNIIYTTPSAQHHQHNTINTPPSTQHHLHNIIHTTPSTLHHHILAGATLGALPSYPFCLIPADTPLVILGCGLFFVLFRWPIPHLDVRRHC